MILEHFDPDDQNFIASKSCLFQPMSPEVLREFIFNDPELEDGGTPVYNEFDDLLDDPTREKNRSPATTLFHNAMDTFSLLDLLYECSIRGSTRVEVNYDKFLCAFSYWDNLK